MSALTELKMEFADILFDIGVIQFGDFQTRASGRTSMYFDFRQLQSDGEWLRRATLLLYILALDGEPFDVVSPIPTGITPVVSGMAFQFDCNMITPRKPKDHGTRASIEGRYERGDRCAVFEDVINSGSAILENLPYLEQAELRISGIYALLARGNKGVNKLKEMGYTVKTVFLLEDLLLQYRESERITHEQYETAMAEL